MLDSDTVRRASFSSPNKVTDGVISTTEASFAVVSSYVLFITVHFRISQLV